MGFLAFDRASLFFHFVSDIRWEQRSLEAWQDGIKLRSCFRGAGFFSRKAEAGSAADCDPASPGPAGQLQALSSSRQAL